MIVAYYLTAEMTKGLPGRDRKQASIDGYGWRIADTRSAVDKWYSGFFLLKTINFYIIDETIVKHYVSLENAIGSRAENDTILIYSCRHHIADCLNLKESIKISGIPESTSKL